MEEGQLEIVLEPVNESTARMIVTGSHEAVTFAFSLVLGVMAGDSEEEGVGDVSPS